MGDVDDFFNRKQKKKQKNKKAKEYVAATDLFNEENIDGTPNNTDSKAEDEWIEQTGEQEFVIESVGGIKRLELEERTTTQENPASDAEGEGGDDGQKGETSWKQQTKNEDESEINGEIAAKAGLPEAKEVPKDAEDTGPGGKSAYVPPSQRHAQMEKKTMSYRRREKIDIESQADFPTLGAAADTTPAGFEEVQGPKAARAWTSSSAAAAAAGNPSTGVSNRFQSLQNH